MLTCNSYRSIICLQSVVANSDCLHLTRHGGLYKLITEHETNGLDVGLPVLYDGDRNELMFYDRIIEYPAGAMIAEYARLRARDIKPVIQECSHYADAPTDENLAGFMDDFQDKMRDRFEPVAGTMATMEIFHVIEEWIKADMAGRGDEYLEALSQVTGYEDINEYIFGDTEYDGIGKSTVGQLVLSAYDSFVTSFVHTSYTFDHIVKFASNEEGADEHAMEMLGALFTEMVSMQHIDYRIINIEGRFRSHYIIKTGMSLLTFEIAHWLDKGVEFVKCANCGRYFVPDGRSDQIYCNYPSPQNKEKTCREIGAQITRANKEKNDVVTREYRKVYMRYKMLTKRHPENRVAAKQFAALTDGMRDWRKNLANGSATTEQFLEWLGQY